MPEETSNVNQTPLSTDEMKSLVVLGRALSDLTRIRILGLLGVRPMYGQELAQALAARVEELRPRAPQLRLGPNFERNLIATVERFNAGAREGRDPDFHRGERPVSVRLGSFRIGELILQAGKNRLHEHAVEHAGLGRAGRIDAQFQRLARLPE